MARRPQDHNFHPTPPYDVAVAITWVLQLLPADSHGKLPFRGTQHCESSLATMAVTSGLLVI
jgi:hypothetical protein